MKDTPIEFSVRVEEGDVKDSKQLLKNTLKEFRANLPQYIEFQILNAQVKKAQFDALIQEGFSEQQALFLCK